MSTYLMNFASARAHQDVSSGVEWPGHGHVHVHGYFGVPDHEGIENQEPAGHRS